MHPVSDPEEFYTENYQDMHRFLYYRGFTEKEDRDDIIQSYALKLLQNPKILKDLVNRDINGNLTTRNLQYASIEWLRTQQRYSTQDSFYVEVQSCTDSTSWSDISAVTSTNLAIDNFLVWSTNNPNRHGPKDPHSNLIDSCNHIMAGEYMSSSERWYKRFQVRRDLYKSHLAKSNDL